MNELSMSASDALMAELRGFRELMEERTDNMASTLIRLEEQVKRTNGRVTTLELENAENKGKAKVSGVLWGGLTAIGVSIASFFITQKL